MTSEKAIKPVYEECWSDLVDSVLNFQGYPKSTRRLNTRISMFRHQLRRFKLKVLLMPGVLLRHRSVSSDDANYISNWRSTFK